MYRNPVPRNYRPPTIYPYKEPLDAVEEGLFVLKEAVDFYLNDMQMYASANFMNASHYFKTAADSFLRIGDPTYNKLSKNLYLTIIIPLWTIAEGVEFKPLWTLDIEEVFHEKINLVIESLEDFTNQEAYLKNQTHALIVITRIKELLQS